MYNGIGNALSLSNKFDVEKGTTPLPPPPLQELKARKRDVYVLTNPRIFSQCGVVLVMDLRKLADRSHLDQKNSIGMQFTYELCTV